MIALSLIKNKQLKIIEKKVDTKLHPKKYRLKIIKSGICASDVPRAFNFMAYKYPLIMGHEFVGEIIKVGNNVSQFEKGDIVSAFPLVPCLNEIDIKNNCSYCSQKKYNLCDNYNYYGSRTDGSFCEILDVFEWNLFKVSKKNFSTTACLTEPTAVAFNIFENLNLKSYENKRILILGGGFIGQVLLRILKSLTKSELFLADRNSFKLSIVKNITKNTILFSKKKKDFKYIKKNLNNKFDIVIEITGSHENFINVLDFVKKDGQVVYSGNIDKDILFKKKQISNILRKQILIKGIWNSTFKTKNNNWKKADSFLSSNQSIKNLITHETSLNDSGKLMKKIYNMKNGIIKNNYLKGVIKV